VINKLHTTVKEHGAFCDVARGGGRGNEKFLLYFSEKNFKESSIGRPRHDTVNGN
jgi:hypothetical protein